MGVGEASGMFPIDSKTRDYDAAMLDKFAALDKVKEYPWDIRDILPKVLTAGEKAGTLTEEGAKRLDVSGNLESGILLAPPEGDAGTGNGRNQFCCSAHRKCISGHICICYGGA